MFFFYISGSHFIQSLCEKIYNEYIPKDKENRLELKEVFQNVIGAVSSNTSMVQDAPDAEERGPGVQTPRMYCTCTAGIEFSSDWDYAAKPPLKRDKPTIEERSGVWKSLRDKASKWFQN